MRHGTRLAMAAIAVNVIGDVGLGRVCRPRITAVEASSGAEVMRKSRGEPADCPLGGARRLSSPLWDDAMREHEREPGMDLVLELDFEPDVEQGCVRQNEAEAAPRLLDHRG